MKKNGFTLVELLAVFAVLAILMAVATPLVLNVIEDTKEEFRRGELETFVNEVQKAYMLVVAEDSLHYFNGYDSGGLNTDGVINFTNDWLADNVIIEGATINCNGEVASGQTNRTTYSNVFLVIDSNEVRLKNCIVDGKEGYNYFNGKVVKY